jgi:hypothetical protein
MKKKMREQALCHTADETTLQQLQHRVNDLEKEMKWLRERSSLKVLKVPERT